MSDPTYPDVPDAPGVPPVLREPGAFATEDADPMTEDGDDLEGYSDPAQWGLFDQDGNPVLVADSVIGIDYREESRVSDYPIEEGAFGSYNKVRLPFDARLIFAVGGSDKARNDFLSLVKDTCESLELFVILTRDISYPNVNPVHYDYKRTAESGVSLLTVDVGLREIKVTSPGTLTTTMSPAGADPVNGGTVTAKPATAVQVKAATPKPSADSPHDTPSNAKPAEVISA